MANAADAVACGDGVALTDFQHQNKLHDINLLRENLCNAACVDSAPVPA